MKKVLATVAALGLVAGVATTASALDLSVTGVYNVSGTTFSNALGGGVAPTGATEGSDSWYEHTFKFLPTLKVNDKVTMKADIRFAKANVWGNDGNDAAAADDLNTADGGNFNVHKIYMEYMSPVGKIRVGRTPGGAWGTAFLDSAGNANRIMWWPSMVSGPWSLMVMTQKSTESDYNTAGSASDTDLYKASLGHKSANGKAAIAYNHTVEQEAGTVISKIEVLAHYKIAGNNVVIEGAHLFGEDTATVDFDANALLVHVDRQFGDLNIGGAYVYASGDDAGSATENETYMGTTGLGKDFEPLYIMTGDGMGVLNGDGVVANAGMVDDGVHALGLFAKYKVSDKLTLNAAIATAMADEEAAGQDDSYGTEYDLGGAYKLLDNLTYEVHLGYLDTGDYFQGGNSAVELNNITILAHALTMTF